MVDVQDRLQAEKIAAHFPVVLEHTRVLALGGGLPIKAGSEVVGAVGVSGSPGKEDVCSQASLDKVADQLR
jgi:uncharacterized protein GlcG (DUF336 family)